MGVAFELVHDLCSSGQILCPHRDIRYVSILSCSSRFKRNEACERPDEVDCIMVYDICLR